MRIERRNKIIRRIEKNLRFHHNDYTCICEDLRESNREDEKKYRSQLRDARLEERDRIRLLEHELRLLSARSNNRGGIK